MSGWVELRCRWKLQGRLHPQARIIEIACRQGRKTGRGSHDMDYFDADTGRQLHYIEVRFRLVRSFVASGRARPSPVPAFFRDEV